MAARRGRISVEDALDAAQDLLAVGVELVDPPMEQVALLATAGGLTAYDAAYVVVAGQRGGVLWTDDGPVFRCLSQEASRARMGAALPGFPVPVAMKITNFQLR